jgi:hypothetical protein
LGISSEELASLSGVGWATIRRFDSFDAVPPSRSGTLERVKAALEREGIEFIGDPVASPGVRLNRRQDDAPNRDMLKTNQP